MVGLLGDEWSTCLGGWSELHRGPMIVVACGSVMWCSTPLARL
jgi:hypothetical protein